MTAVAKARQAKEQALEALRAAVRRGDPDAVLRMEDADRARKIRAVAEEAARHGTAALEGSGHDHDDSDRSRAGAPVSVRSADNG